MINMQDFELSHDAINEMVSSIDAEDHKYTWHYRLNPTHNENIIMTTEGNKQHSVIHLDDVPPITKTEASKEASVIHNFMQNLSEKISEKSSSLLEPLHRLHLAHQSAFKTIVACIQRKTAINHLIV